MTIQLAKFWSCPRTFSSDPVRTLVAISKPDRNKKSCGLLTLTDRQLCSTNPCHQLATGNTISITNHDCAYTADLERFGIWLSPQMRPGNPSPWELLRLYQTWEFEHHSSLSPPQISPPMIGPIHLSKIIQTFCQRNSAVSPMRLTCSQPPRQQ